MPPKTNSDKVTLNVESQLVTEVRKIKEELFDVINDVKAKIPKDPTFKEPIILKLKEIVELHQKTDTAIDELAELFGTTTFSL